MWDKSCDTYVHVQIYIQETAVEEQVLRALFEGTRVTIKNQQYPRVYKNIEEFFRSPALGETYYELPILERSIFDHVPDSQGPIRALLFNRCGEIIGVIFHQEEWRRDF